MEQFLFNFENKEDLNSVLSQGPFHHNFCMFVLVCWEPVINDNYPSMVSARGRLTFKQDGGSQVSEEKSKPFRERASSYSRVQRSTYSLRAKRDSKHNDTQYKPYAYIRAKASVAYQDPRTEPVLMTAKAQSAAESSNTMDAKLKSTTKQTGIKDDDFTFRPSSERAHASHALHVDEQGNGDHSADEDMQDVVHGNELMLVHEDNLWGDELKYEDDLTHRDGSGPSHEIVHGSSILMIKAKERSDREVMNFGDEQKALTRSVTCYSKVGLRFYSPVLKPS
ncbi:BnaA03g59560D [Brassica napus]|uniref:BnaA03g59560D protein n=1 Tax=Brassica napus TaxID=3708 RepID=A0A078ITC4_BRANA|nr:BnaA03g59560D [Brassica napus]